MHAASRGARRDGVFAGRGERARASRAASRELIEPERERDGRGFRGDDLADVEIPGRDDAQALPGDVARLHSGDRARASDSVERAAE